jgi:outer membrane protein TolC
MKAILPLAFALTLLVPAGAQDAPKSGPMTVDLATALRLAGARNTEIARAREAVAQAASQLRQKRYLLIPALTVGASVEHHDGPLQESSGRVRNISRTSANFGVGAGAIAAGPVGAPGISLSVDLADAWFEPLVAKQNREAITAARDALGNLILLATAETYLDLTRTTAKVRAAEEAVNHADELARLTADFAKSGEGLESDAQRARVEQFIQQRELEQAMEAVAITRARLASLLHLEADVALHPADTDVAPLSVTDADAKLGELIATALQSRPEIKQGSAQVRLASDRLRQSRYSPWIPNLALGASASAFGGGVGGGVKNVDGRADVTALAFWRWEAFGLTEAEKVKERKSEMLQQEFARQSSVDQIIAEVRQAHAQTDSRRRQIAFAEQAVAAARSSYELNRSRIFEKQGLPIEVLQAIQSLARARALYIDTVTDFNQSQYRLLTAIGNGTDK